MATLESAAVFEERALAIGVSQVDINALKVANFGSFAKFAWSCTYQPGAQDDSSLKSMLEAAIARAPSAGEMSSWRRLFYESFTLAAQDLKSRVDRGDDSAPRRLPGPERNTRYVNLQNRLTGVTIQDDAEPSDALVDSFCDMFDSNRLKWLAWEKCSFSFSK